MNDQQNDQAALNGLVDDCYPDGWPWERNDIWEGPDGIQRFVSTKPYGTPGTWLLPSKYPDAIHISGGLGWHPAKYPLAGTWVEGRLRELIGEQFHCLSYWPNGWHCEAYLEPHDKEVPTVYEGPTPITALVAALRVLKQKEVKSE